MKLRLLAPLLCLPFCVLPSRAEGAAAGLFPFVVPGDDVSAGITDMSFLNERPADRLVTVNDGHFYAGGERIRFWGINNDYEANYPTHEQPEMLAGVSPNWGSTSCASRTPISNTPPGACSIRSSRARCGSTRSGWRDWTQTS